jgi:phosphatidylinositol 4-kinase
MGVSYLFRYASSGVQDYLVNQLYSLPVDQIEFYLTQLCYMLVRNHVTSKALERFVIDQCCKSLHMALKVCWQLLSWHDELDVAVTTRARDLYELCETAAVNGTRDQALLTISDEESRDQALTELALVKADRCEFFYGELTLIEALTELGQDLRLTPVEGRLAQLRLKLEALNAKLFSYEARDSKCVGQYVPLHTALETHHVILRFVADEAVVLNSRDRAPYLVYIEVLQSESVTCGDPNLYRVGEQYMTALRNNALWDDSVTAEDSVPTMDSIVFPSEAPRPRDQPSEDKTRDLQNRHVKEIPEELKRQLESALKEEKENPELAAGDGPLSGGPGAINSIAHIDTPLVRSELFKDRTERIRKKSPYGHLPGWCLKSMIVKVGDDCRQEYLALQLIGVFHYIFTQAGLPNWVLPYKILILNDTSCLIETILDAASLHQIKKANNCISLSQLFVKRYGPANSPRHSEAVKQFMHSLAGYSIVCYLLQIKDRHNGNIMLDEEGHLIHIDYGFMLWNSPGGLNFESAPFKLTREYIDLMGGAESATFSYFKSIFVKGFLEVRKHQERIVTLVEIMLPGSRLPCLQAGQPVIDALKERFAMSLTESECITHAESLVARSLDTWRTRQYDKFQYMSNGILY